MQPFQDMDADGLTDGMEMIVLKSDSNNPDSASTYDGNGDGQPDFPSVAGNYVTDGDEDLDHDELSNLKELWMGTNPLIANNHTADSDADGLPNWAEVLITIYTADPDPSPQGDSDSDGVDNFTEVLALTDPSWPDAVFCHPWPPG